MSDSFSLTDAEHNQLVLRLGELVSALEQVEDPELREQVIETLQSLDLIHREALHRLVGTLQNRVPGILPELLRDPVVQTLLLLYDFLPEPVEETQRPAVTPGFVPLSQLEIPVWIPVGHDDEFAEGGLVAREVNQHPLLLCRVEGRIYAVLNRCLDSILPLQLGRIEGKSLVCPWHQCRYRVENGTLEGSDRALPVFPVQLAADGTVRVGFNIPAQGSGDES